MMRPISGATPRIRRLKPQKSLVVRQRKIATTTPLLRPVKIFPWRPIARIVLSALIVVSVVWLLNSPIFLVRAVTVDGVNNVPKQTVANLVPLDTNIWLYPAKETTNKINAASPLIADAAIYRSLPGTIRVQIAERVLAMQWQSGDTKYWIGLDGKVIMAAGHDLPIPTVVDTSAIPVVVGQVVATPGFVQFVGETAKDFTDTIGVVVDHFEVSQTTFDLIVVPVSGPKIMLDTMRDPNIQLKAGKLVLDKYHDSIKEYLDLRVPGMGYFK